MQGVGGGEHSCREEGKSYGNPSSGSAAQLECNEARSFPSLDVHHLQLQAEPQPPPQLSLSLSRGPKSPSSRGSSDRPMKALALVLSLSR